MEPIVEAQNLTKHYGDVEALAGLDLVAASGKVLAVLGPNGAGKTTFVRTIATLTRPDAGTLRVAGIDVVRHPERVRRVIGLAGQTAAVEPAMTGRENLRMVARLFGHGRREGRVAADSVLEQLGLTEDGDRLVRTYSGGMRRRLDLGASLVGAPRLLLLDEPTTGLDPRSRNELWRAIEALVDQGTDVLLTTQYLDEADRLADQIAIFDHGRLVAEGTPGELKSRAGHDVIDVRVRDAEDLGARRRVARHRGDGRPGALARRAAGDRRRRGARRRDPRARRRRRRARRHRAAPPDARRRLPRPHGPHHRRTDPRGGPRMNTLAPAGTAGALTTTGTVAVRTGLQLARTPQVLGIAVVQSVLFLLMFRYVIGGAIGVEGVSYVDFLVPGFVVAGLIFTAGGSAVAVAEDAASGLYDRLRSLPIPGVAVLAGRSLADAALMLFVALVTLGVGVLVGFRVDGSAGEALAAIGLVAVFSVAFAWVFVWLGLVSGSAQAAQGLGILGVPFSFLSSAFVPVDSMPAALEAFADHQPLTFMVDAVRGLLLGDAATATFEHSLSYHVTGSLLWSLALVAVFAPLAVRAYRRR